MLKLAGEIIEGQLADHLAKLDAHTKNLEEILRTGEYIHPVNVGNYLTRAVVTNRLYGIPIMVARDITVDRIALRVTTLDAGKSARLGIYNNDGVNLHPGSLLLDAGEVSVGSTGVKAITINQALTKGIYHLALVSDGTPTLHWYTRYTAPLGVDASYLQPNACWYVAHTYAALPDPYTTTTTFEDLRCPTVALRLASLD